MDRKISGAQVISALVLTLLIVTVVGAYVSILVASGVLA